MVCLAGRRVLASAHDAAGNMTLAARPGDEADAGDGLVLVYDAWNHLIEVWEDSESGGDGVLDTQDDTLVVTYEYDGQKRRIETNVAGESGLDTYYNTQWQVLEVHEGGDADHPLKQFVWDIRYIDAPVVRFHDGDTNGTIDDTLYYTTDANMNVTALVNTSGTVLERVVYDPYGKATFYDGSWTSPSDTSSYDNVVLYCGYHLDSETGLYHVRNRMYHATLGRWIQRDPVGYLDGAGLYQFAGSSPANALDPSGLFVIEFDDCDEEQQEVVRRAAEAVEDRLEQLIREFNKLDAEFAVLWAVDRNRKTNSPKQTTRYSNYHRDMMVNFRKMKDMLQKGVGVECECECKEGVKAYVNAFFANTWAQMPVGDIHICPPFWSLGADGQSENFFHELSHRTANTRDWAGEWDRRYEEDGGVTLTGPYGAAQDAYHVEAFMHSGSLVVLTTARGFTGALDVCFPKQ